MRTSARPPHPQHPVNTCLARRQKNLEGARPHGSICRSYSLMDNTQDMKPQDQHSQDAAGFLSLGVEEDGGELHEAKSAGILLIGEGEEEKGTHPEPEQGAASAEGKEVGAEEEAKEGSHGGPGGLGTPGPMCDEHHEGSGDSDGEPGEQGQEEQRLLANVQRPRPGGRQQVAQRTMFTEVQMRELEHIFQRNRYPNLLMRQDIARRMNVPEARVQVWFKNRRRRQRALTLRSVHSVALGNRIGINLGVPHIAILNRQPVWIWYLQPAWIWYPQPLPLGLLLPPMLPFRPLFLPPPPPLFFPPMPPGAPHRRVWAWYFSVFYP